MADDTSSSSPYKNPIWGGAKLADVLELVGIPKSTSATSAGGKHVEFVSIDRCKEEKGGPYKASIPLSEATNPEADVLLAYEMNGKNIATSQGFFMQKDYKMFPPLVNTRRPQMDFPVQSAICLLEDVNVRSGKITIKGYAVSGGGRGIERVDISIDGDINSNTDIVAKAVDTAANVQPEKVEDIWNLRGVLNTSWHRENHRYHLTFYMYHLTYSSRLYIAYAPLVASWWDYGYQTTAMANRTVIIDILLD
ncbi:hypothetical protein L2E82_36837 [Cichorium intybus]|uniref:Uncharacterized protein n=1 Tax=Cichorium intybus TaxID=13427 RepID=A0ACB9ACG8_CICIN|nr:hypothetical protein L2E82_36837 [Cichorium intybus]